MFLKRITLQPIYTFSPLYINMIVVLLIILLLNLVILAKECKEEATIIIIEQKIPDDLKSKVFLFFHSHMRQKWDGWNYQWTERNGVTSGNQCDVLYTHFRYMINTVLMNEWISQTEFKIKMHVKCTLLTLLYSASILLHVTVLLCSAMHLL